MIRKKILPVFLLGITSALFLTHVPCLADEIRYPVPSYQGEELEKIREWEKTWAGKKITPANIAQIKEFIPENLYQLLTNPEKWGEIWFEIIPYEEVKPTKGDIKFTKEGKCSIGSNGELLNYVSGIPFPNPKTGMEIAYNFDNKNLGDNLAAIGKVFLVDGRRKYDRHMAVKSWYLYFSGRREIHPVPELPKNKKGIFRGWQDLFTAPASLEGNRQLTVKWKKRSRDYGTWVYSSASRRVTRKSTAERQSSVNGVDFCADDQWVYDFAINRMKYKFTGRKELLVARHQNLQQVYDNHIPGQCLFSGFKRERVKTFALDCTHTDPNYLYFKQNWYVDPETWQIVYADKYDKRGKLWRIFDTAFTVSVSVRDKVSTIHTACMPVIVDVDRMHSTCISPDFTYGSYDKLITPAYFNPKALLKHGY